jgi:energy-coupling factor transport system substrate-specific component
MGVMAFARRTLDRSEARFLVAGGVAALVNWLVRFPVELVLPYFAALLVATCIGMTCGFLLYRAWVFPGSTRPLGRQVRDFILVNLTGQATMLAVAAVVRQLLLWAGVGTLLAGASAHALGIAAGAIVNYLGHRHVTFTGARGGGPQNGR